MAGEKHLRFTIAFSDSEIGGYYGLIKEMPGVMSYGKTTDELKDNLLDAIDAMFEFNRANSDFPSNGNVEEDQLEYCA